MRRTMDQSFWREVRWRVALQLLLWGAKAAPWGEMKGRLTSILLGWIEDEMDGCAADQALRAGGSVPLDDLRKELET